MKHIFIWTLMLLVAIKSFSQQIDTTTMSRQATLLLKSKKQKSGAWTLLVGGTAFVGLGFLIGNRNNSSFGEAGAGVILGGLGVLSTIGSIPLFIASGRNKRKAEAIVSLDVQEFRLSLSPGAVSGLYPSAQVKIKLQF